jgi:hypothetical protein
MEKEDNSRALFLKYCTCITRWHGTGTSNMILPPYVAPTVCIGVALALDLPMLL